MGQSGDALVHAGRSARPDRGERESSLHAQCHQVQLQPLPKQPLVVSTASWLQTPPSLSPGCFNPNIPLIFTEIQ